MGLQGERRSIKMSVDLSTAGPPLDLERCLSKCSLVMKVSIVPSPYGAKSPVGSRKALIGRRQVGAEKQVSQARGQESFTSSLGSQQRSLLNSLKPLFLTVCLFQDICTFSEIISLLLICSSTGLMLRRTK